MSEERPSLVEARKRFAREMAAASRSDDPRLEAAFAQIRREDFLPPGPWLIVTETGPVETPSADPIHIHQNVLVALDSARGINNGEPALHAAWLGRAAPRPGECVCQIGAGTGYYTALLANLCSPGGRVVAFEIDPALAAAAQRNLIAFANARVVEADASAVQLPPCDLLYVNAGVVAPPRAWLEALRPGGRMLVPWQPAASVGLTLLMTHAGAAFRVEPLMPSIFIACVGASSPEGCGKVPKRRAAWAARSAWLTGDRPPDRTAVAIYPHVWFSSSPAA